MELPSGTVTFLFTDIEGSTVRFQADQEGMPAVIRRHNGLLRSAIEGQSGYVVKTEGDAFFAAFHTARDALLAAIACQRALLAEPWGDGTELPVRMAMHTGRAQAEEGDYLALSVNRAARLLPGAHGGQILLSAATHAQLQDDLPPEVELLDLGMHRLKDLERDEHVFQVMAPGLPTGFGPQAVRLLPATALPATLTPFVGREAELAAAGELMERPEVRLLTLTGPGGTGKTRLALELAAAGVERYPHGLILLELAALTDPALVAPALAAQLGVKETAGQGLIEGICAYLHAQRRLLVVDNAEHLRDAVCDLATHILRSCPDVELLVTSRHPLAAYGEREYPVPPLDLPPRPPPPPPPEGLSQYDAVALFLEGARRSKPDFGVTQENAPAIAELCHRLDGLPLAVELAAARIRQLGTPQAILKRLSLDFVAGRVAGRDERQRTLRGAITWSHDLLGESEQRVFSALSVFACGCTLEAAEAVAGDDAFDAVVALVDHSLVRQEEEPNGEPRYRMLETIRAYAAEQLDASGDRDACEVRHAAYFANLARRTWPTLQGPEQAMGLDLLEREHDNLRAALETLLLRDPAAALRTAGFLGEFWFVRGHHREGCIWLDRALAATAGTPSGDLAAGFHQRGRLSAEQGEYGEAQHLYDRSLTISRQLGDRRGAAGTLHELGYIADRQGRYAEASKLYEESLAINRDLGNRGGVAATLRQLGVIAALQGRYGEARGLCEESLSIRRETGDERGVAETLHALGYIAVDQGEYTGARGLYEESLAIRRQLGNRLGVTEMLYELAHIAMLQDDHTAAQRQYEEGLAISRELGNRLLVMVALPGLGGIATLRGDYPEARRLFEETLTISRELGERGAVATARHQLGYIADQQGDQAEARRQYEESLIISQELGDRLGATVTIARMTRHWWLDGERERVARLAGAVSAIRESIGVPPLGPVWDETIAGWRGELGTERFDAVWMTGQSLTLDEAVALALRR